MVKIIMINSNLFIKLYLISLPSFVLLDFLWLGIISKNFYNKHIGFLTTTSINWIAAILFYLLFLAGLVVFVIAPGIKNGNWLNIVLMGALFGLVCYATYDLTNLATIKDWPLVVTIVDLIWGSFISASVSVITFLIYSKYWG